MGNPRAKNHFFHFRRAVFCLLVLPNPPSLMLLLLTMPPYLISTLHPFPDIGRHVIPPMEWMECRHLLSCASLLPREEYARQGRGRGLDIETDHPHNCLLAQIPFRCQHISPCLPISAHISNKKQMYTKIF